MFFFSDTIFLRGEMMIYIAPLEFNSSAANCRTDICLITQTATSVVKRINVSLQAFYMRTMREVGFLWKKRVVWHIMRSIAARLFFLLVPSRSRQVLADVAPADVPPVTGTYISLTNFPPNRRERRRTYHYVPSPRLE